MDAVRVHDIRDAAAFTTAVLRAEIGRIGMTADPHQREDMLAFLLEQMLLLAASWCPDRGVPFSRYCWRLLPLRLVDWFRSELGDSRRSSPVRIVSIEGLQAAARGRSSQRPEREEWGDWQPDLPFLRAVRDELAEAEERADLYARLRLLDWRSRTVWLLRSAGYHNDEIALELGVSTRTIRRFETRIRGLLHEQAPARGPEMVTVPPWPAVRRKELWKTGWRCEATDQGIRCATTDRSGRKLFTHPLGPASAIVLCRRHRLLMAQSIGGA